MESLVPIRKKKLKNSTGNLDWQYGGQDTNVIIENKSLNVKLLRYSIVSEKGDSLYDTFSIKESGNNVVVIVVDKNQSIGLLHEWRPIPEKWFWACVRGFSDSKCNNCIITAKKEFKEETGYTKDDIEATDLGVFYSNTSFFEKPIRSVLLKIASDFKIIPQEKEGISNFCFFTKSKINEMVYTGEISCQMTLGAISKYFAYLCYSQQK